MTVLQNYSYITYLLLFSFVMLLLFSILRPQRYFNSFLLAFFLLVLLIQLNLVIFREPSYALLASVVMIFLALLFVPFLLIHNGRMMKKKESGSLGNRLSSLLGIAILLGEFCFIGFFFNVVFERYQNWPTLVLGFIGLSAFYFCTILLLFVLYMAYIQFLPHFNRFDYIIIHGSGLIGENQLSKLLQMRCDKAIEVFRKCNGKPVIIPSGGQGDDETISEAEAMEQYLLSQGIPSNHILKEDQSTTTMENLINSRKLIGEDTRKRVALVTSNYHVYRCLLYARSIHFDCVGIAAPVAFYYWPSAVIREFVAVFTRKKYLFFIITGYLLFLFIPYIVFSNYF